MADTTAADPFALPDVSHLVIAAIGGTGDQGRGLAYRWARAGLSVIIGSREEARAAAAAAELGMGVRGMANADAATAADVVLIAVPWAGHDATVESLAPQLAGKVVRDFPDHDIDVVIPVPDTSRTAALQVAYHLGVKYREGFIKNRYIGRTFIMPGQAERVQSVRRKLNAIPLEFRNKNVLLVDDSIVRGTTSKQIIKLARDAGAKKVYFASAAPPVRYPNVYGIDMPAASELIANGRTTDEIEKLIGADRLIYQDLNGLIRSVRHDNSSIAEFDTSCFSGEYVTGDVTEAYLDELEERRNDAAKQAREQDSKPDAKVVSL